MIICYSRKSTQERKGSLGPHPSHWELAKDSDAILRRSVCGMSREGKGVFCGWPGTGTGELLKEISRQDWKEPEGCVPAPPSKFWDSSVLRRAWGQVGKGKVKISTRVKKRKLANRCTAMQGSQTCCFGNRTCFFFLLQGALPNCLTSLWARSWQLCEVHLPGSVLPAEVVAFLPLPVPFKYSFLLLMASPSWFSSRTWDVVQGKKNDRWDLKLECSKVLKGDYETRKKCLSSI